jgi:hypothetical protein
MFDDIITGMAVIAGLVVAACVGFGIGIGRLIWG